MQNPIHEQLLALSRDIGREDRRLAILGEGNTSARLPHGTFVVKASGACLATLTADDLVECRLAALTELLDQETLSDAQVEAALLSSRVDSRAKKPSVEAMFHAWLLSLPDVNFVGHAHPVSANQVLCSPRADDFAVKRLFPDEIVCCGAMSVLVPYTDPGLKLSQAIRERTESFIRTHSRPPRLILLQNHGIITLGPTPQSVLSAMLMAEKAAAIFVGAAALGGPVCLSDADVQRIAGRPDEAYRQRALGIS